MGEKMSKKKREKQRELEHELEYLRAEVANIKGLWRKFYEKGQVNYNTIAHRYKYALYGYGPDVPKFVQMFESERPQPTFTIEEWGKR